MPEPTGSGPAPDTFACWRCGKSVDRLALSCPHCRAPRRGLGKRFRATPAGPGPLGQMIALFGVLLAVSVLYGVATSFGAGDASGTTPSQRLGWTLGVELIDTIVVAAALLVVRRPAVLSGERVRPLGAVWVCAGLALAATLGANAAYHSVLRGLLGVTRQGDPLLAAGGPLVLVLYCLQPAVVEELFFRYVALDSLRGVMGLHAAVGVSSLMFGLAHVGVPLSIPMLALVGVPLAYARVASGGLALPMLFHFLHNWIVLLRS
jgi:membrane protease YdiL (CAAX protease family)